MKPSSPGEVPTHDSKNLDKFSVPRGLLASLGERADTSSFSQIVATMIGPVAQEPRKLSMRAYRILALLLLAFAAATWLPEPARWLRAQEFAGIRVPSLLLALLLFCAGLSSRPQALRQAFADRGRLAGDLLASHSVPLLAALITVLLFNTVAAMPSSIAIGLVVIVAMPIANSSVGWSSLLGGRVPTSLALLVVSTALSPLVAPTAIGLVVPQLANDTSLLEIPWGGGMSFFFVVWVLIPVALGIACKSRSSPTFDARFSSKMRLLSLAALLALNYLNGSACLPLLKDDPWLLGWPCVACVTLIGASFLLLRGLEYLRRRPIVTPTGASDQSAQESSSPGPVQGERLTLDLAVTMRNTGAALVFAGEALPRFPLVSMTIITYTLVQHCWAAGILARSHAGSDQD